MPMRKRTDPKVALLRTLPSLATVRERDLATVAPLVEDIWLAAGSVLVAEGATGHEVVLIVEGTASLTAHGVAQGTVGPGDVVGDTAVREGTPHPTTVTAETPMHLLVAGPESYRAFVRHPVVARTAASSHSSHLRRADVASYSGRPSSAG